MYRDSKKQNYARSYYRKHRLKITSHNRSRYKNDSDFKKRTDAYNKAWYARNREKARLICKRWRIKNRKHIREKYRQYYAANRDRIAQHRLYRMKHEDAYRKRILAQGEKWRSIYAHTPEIRYRYYKNNAKREGWTFKLTLEEFMMFWNKPCYYCGETVDTIGMDRVDNSQGYIDGNIVPCCQHCNRSKRNRTQMDFIATCNRVAKRHPIHLYNSSQASQ